MTARHYRRAEQILAADHPYEDEPRRTAGDRRLEYACIELGASTYDVWNRAYSEVRGAYFTPAPTPQTILAFARTLTKHGRLPSKRERRAHRRHGIQWARRQLPMVDVPF